MASLDSGSGIGPGFLLFMHVSMWPHHMVILSKGDNEKKAPSLSM